MTSEALKGCCHKLQAKVDELTNKVEAIDELTKKLSAMIDPCSSGAHNCDINAMCSRTNDSFVCTCMSEYTGDGVTCTRIVPKNCADVYKSGNGISGVRRIDPDGLGEFEVFCDQTTDGGGWTVFQKRMDGSVDFFRGWDEYKQGFGNLRGEVWLGLDKLHRLTVRNNNELRVDLSDAEDNTAYAVYSTFAVENETNKYKLSLGSYSGTAGDSLGYHRGMPFSTKDRDNDNSSRGSCASIRKGAWWYDSCLHSNLNARYLPGQIRDYDADGMVWKHWKNPWYCMKSSQMKIRPKDF